MSAFLPMIKLIVPIAFSDDRSGMLAWCKTNVDEADYYIRPTTRDGRVCFLFAFFNKEDAVAFMLRFQVPESYKTDY